MTRPAVAAAADDLYRRLGDGLPRGDEQVGWTLLKLCQALALPLEPVNELADTDWTLTVDPDAADDLRWLGQWIGIRYDARVDGEANRQRIRDRRQWTRGTLTSIRNAALETLLPGSQVVVIERDGGPYKLTVRTYTAQTPDSAATLAAVQAVMPAGHTLDYAATNGNTVYAISQAFATVADVTAYFATVNDVLVGSLP